MAGVLDGQVALVTGGSGGIGRAVSLELANHGAAVAVNYNSNEAGADAVVAEVTGSGGKAQAFQGDQSNEESASALVDAVLESMGPIRVLINNAGTTADRTLARMSSEEWHKVIDANVNGLFYITRKVWGPMGEAGGGHIVCISSIVGEMGRLGLVNYGTSKAAVIGFVRGSAREGARTKIQVNAVAPGFVTTDMIGGLSEEQLGNLAKETVMGRLGKPEEIASMVRFIVTEGTWITGQVINVNGGHFIG